jgi:cyclopropane fatty-acyl-phospholipid synthase-like methyltransferase
MVKPDEAEVSGILKIGDWSSWHDEYANPDSELNARKRAVQAQVAAVVDLCPPGPVTVASICGGQGRELIGALEHHPRRQDVRGRIVELDEANSAFAREWARQAGLDNLEVMTGDASISAAYAGLPPVDLVVISGVFGHICRADQQKMIEFLRQICRQGGRVVWTFYNRDEDRTRQLRDDFQAGKFVEESYQVLDGDFAFTITRSRHSDAKAPLDPDARIFTFGSSRTQPQEPES